MEPRVWSQTEHWPLLATRMTLCEDTVNSAQTVHSDPLVLSGGNQRALWIQVTGLHNLMGEGPFMFCEKSLIPGLATRCPLAQSHQPLAGTLRGGVWGLLSPISCSLPMAPAPPHPTLLPHALATAAPSALLASSSRIHFSRLNLLATSSLKPPCTGVGFHLSLFWYPLPLLAASLN